MKNKVKIIAGKWRNRNITFPDNLLLRPSPSRIRETLFNWLMPIIKGADCLDLFAGSGVLGFEALSRGASSIIALENNKKIASQIQKNSEVLGVLKGTEGAEGVDGRKETDGSEEADESGRLGGTSGVSETAGSSGRKCYNLIVMEAVSWLKQCTRKFDVIFLDPPYNHYNMLLNSLDIIAKNKLLRDESSRLYFETDRDFEKDLINELEIIRSKKAGSVYYYLVKRKITG